MSSCSMNMICISVSSSTIYFYLAIVCYDKSDYRSVLVNTANFVDRVNCACSMKLIMFVNESVNTTMKLEIYIYL